MAHQGLLSWANSVRLTMTKDPGREAFKDEVQKHGFLFLDDYLDNIVSGTKQDPLIELVKTPGRKKAIVRKPKLMSSKLGTIVSLSFEDKFGTENRPPEEVSQMFPPISQSDNRPENKSEAANPRPPLISIQPIDNASQPMHDQSNPSAQQLMAVPTPEILPLTNQEHSKDLSVIAEDEEPSERSRASTSAPVGRSSSGSDSFARLPFEAPSSIPIFPPEQGHRDSNLSRHDDATTTSSSSMDTFHSIPLRSPTSFMVREVPQPEAAKSQEQNSNILSTQRDPELQPPPLSKAEGDHTTADPKDEHLFSERKSSDKHVTPSFPTLPEPMPLRKSMKPPPRDPSLNAVMTGVATPGGPVGGKRTSWLMKAREVKALEGGSKKPFAFATSLLSSVPFMPQSAKRKSEEMFTQAVLEDEERPAKIAKTQENEVAPRLYKNIEIENVQQQAVTLNSRSDEQIRDPEPEVVLGLLKKTVEGLGIRGSKTLGKSLGGPNAATILAEARAAAEARVAERDREEEEKTTNMGPMPAVSPASREADPDSASGQQNEGRLSISDLFPKDGRMKDKHKAPEKLFQSRPQVEPSSSGQSQDLSRPRESTSTTPPNSPPAQIQSIQMPTGPQSFNKHAPVFVPPVPAPIKPSVQQAVFNPPSKTDDIPSPKPRTSLTTFPPPMSFKAPSAFPLTAQSTLESVQSDGIFDREDVPTWMPSTQDTEYTYDNQTQSEHVQVCDEDDSWPVDEKLAAGVQWTFGGSKEDSMTWSTLPTQSQRGDTGPTAEASPIQEKQQGVGASNKGQIPGAFDQEMNEALDEPHVVTRDQELEEAVLGAPKTMPGITESKLPPRSQSQMSMASSESSQSQLGFLGQASKLLSSALGTSKKKQPEVKAVLQKAAVAAKKQQEEADKKAARLKEMESRRQLALQRKAEEEKARILDEERKMKEDAERRKKEREGNTEKRALKLPSAKKDEESQKKRKIEVEKKQELKKPGPSVLLGKSHLKSATKQTAASSSFAYGSLAYAASTTNLEAEPSGTHKGKGKDQSIFDDEVSQPSQLVQSQMAARAKAQIDAAKKVEPAIPSESIELPDINSEYSDSEDEDRVRTFNPPDWAQSPELRQALEMQSTINPDDIFGAVRPLKMEEIFKTRTSRFRARTSSANWTGTDRLTLQEEKEYARRMGFN